jgi:putative membrane protein
VSINGTASYRDYRRRPHPGQRRGQGLGLLRVNVFFWAKIGTFLVVGLLSIVQTVAIIRWRNALKSDAAFAPPADGIRRVRGYLWAEVALFLLLPVFAAAMARGYGELTP